MATKKITPKKRIRNTKTVTTNSNPGFGGPGLGGGFNPIGFPFNQGSPLSPQISQTNTEFINLRWYLISNNRQLLSQMYVELGLVQAVIDLPVDDALRGGVIIKSKQLDEEQLEELTNSLDRDDDLNTVGQGAKWDRLFGGSGILILTDQDPETPLELDQITEDSDLEFRAADMWELYWDKQNTEGYDPSIQQEDFEFYNYYGEKIHKSRVMRLKGMTAPSFIRPRLRGWGFSVCEPLVRSLNQYLKGTDVIFETLDEFKVDYFKIKNLANTLLSNDNSVYNRIAAVNFSKNYQNAVVLDSEEEWDHRQLSFAGLQETMQGIREQVASDMRMPMLKLFGTPATGLNASDESSLEVYNSMVEGQVRNKIKFPILRVCEIKCQKLFGFIPDDLSIDFEPLRVLSAVDEENVKTQKFTRLSNAVSLGWITAEDARDACNKGDLLDVSLDKDSMGGYMQDSAREGVNNPYKPQDIDNPGADRADTRKARATEVGGIGKGKPIKAKRIAKEDADKRSAGNRNYEKEQEEPRNGEKGITDPKNRPIKNSAAFDLAAYEADGGDKWIDPRREEFFSNPGNVDEALWAKAKEASKAALGEIKWQFVTWFYKKQGGKFN